MRKDITKATLFHTIQIPIYPVVLHITFGHTDEELKKHIAKIGHEWSELLELKPHWYGMCTKTNRGAFVIRLEQYPVTPKDYGYLQHEILHATVGILSDIGLKLTDESEEAYTYLTQFITEEIYKQIEW